MKYLIGHLSQGEGFFLCRSPNRIDKWFLKVSANDTGKGPGELRWGYRFGRYLMGWRNHR